MRGDGRDAQDRYRAIRAEYEAPGFDIGDTDPDPFVQFATWFSDAVEAGETEPNAMTLSTIDDGAPTSRIVLLKDTTDGFTFFTNYGSDKARQISSSSRVALCFLWQSVHRQVRIEGTASRVSDESSDAYFVARPRGSQLAAVASDQSRELPDRATLVSAMASAAETFEGEAVPRPNWGGFLVTPTKLEFWQGQPNRLHDRIVYLPDGPKWRRARLAP